MTGGMSLVLTLIIMGGAIAYVGNHIGRYIGRSRLSLFGLRPKHSSILMTIVTGMVIAGFSLALLTIASEGVRTALFDMGELRRALAETEKEVQEVMASRNEALAQTERLKQEAESAVADLNAATEQLRSVEERLLLAEAEVERGKGEVTRLQQLALEFGQSVQEMEQTEASLRRQIDRLSQQYGELERALRLGQFAFLKDDVIVATTLSGPFDPAEVAGMITELLSEARETVSGDGLEGMNDRHAVAGVRWSDQGSYEQAVRLLSTDSGEWVVRLSASQNTVRGEDLLVDIRLFPRRRVFRQGEVVGQRTIDPATDNAELILLDLIGEVNDLAVLNGMITAPDGSVSQLTDGDLTDTVLALRNRYGPAVVEAVVSADTWNTEGPFRFELVIRDD